jgi:hypothetical protein
MRLSALFLSMTLAALAQTTGRIEGVVRDPAGMAAAGAQLRVVETQTGAERTLSADGHGWYLAPGLPSGIYQIEVSHSGFRSQIRKDVELVAGRAARVDFTLQLGEVRDSVVVSGEAAPVSTAASDWGGAIGQRKLASLPLNGRDLFDLASQQSGATAVANGNKSMATGMGARVTVNGARPNQNSFRMDGIYINDATALAPSSATGRLLGMESIQELRLVASPFDAEYGRGAGAPFVAVSKSGTNQWHGSAYEFFRNSALDAKNFFDAPDQNIPPLRRNQFGGALGGPVRPNRLFFFTNYEGSRVSSGQTFSSVVPVAEARQGRLPGRTVTVSPLIEPYLALYPLPNGRDYGDGTGEFVTQGITTSREDYVTGKVDYVFSNRFRHTLRYTFDDAAQTRPDRLEVYSFQDNSRYHFLHTETQFIQSPNTIHSLRAGFSRVWNNQDSTQPASIPASLSFVPGQPMGHLAFTSGLANLGGATGDSVSLLPRRFVVNDYQLNDSLTHIRGAHTLRLGGGFDRVQFNQRADRAAKGTYTFGSLDDFLRARPTTGEVMLPGSDSIRGWRQSIFSAFVQDEFRLGPRLNVTLGVRYEAYTTPTEVNGKVATLPDVLHDTAFRVGGPLFDNPSADNFAPRVAVAYSPFESGKTVVRAGAGIFFDLISTRELVVAGLRVPPFFNLVSVSKPSFPNLLAAIQGAQPSNSLDMLDYYLPQPYVMQFQFTVQQEVARDTVVQAGYAGARGVHLAGQISEANPFTPQIQPDGTLLFAPGSPRLNPAFGRTRLRRTQFDSCYHALQVSIERRWRRGISAQAKYAWGKSLDNTSNAINKDFVNSDGTPTMFDYSQNRGRSDFDLRHTFGVNFSWALPGAGRGLAGRILRGWELHGLMQAQSGLPFNPTIGFDRARLTSGTAGDPGERPMYIAAPGARVILGDPRRWFDSLAFGLPAAGTYGNLGRNVFDGPGLVSVDLALHKVFWATERQSVRLRVEAFNVSNHPNFQIPSGQTLFTSSLNRVGSAGQITATTTTSRQVQLALKWMF